MQKNNFCPLPNKVLMYEEIDLISHSIFNSKKKLFTQSTNNKHKIRHINNNNYHRKKNNNIAKKKINYKKINDIATNYMNKKYINYFSENSESFYIYYIANKESYDSVSKISNKNKILQKFYSYKESSLIFPSREFYFRHHLEFLERPNLINIYFNKKEKEYGLIRLTDYQSQKKKEKMNITKNSLSKDNKKIFDTNILEEIENYSTTITQSSNNEKCGLTPLEILRRCEDNKKLLQKLKEKKINNINKNDVDNDKDKKSKITFSESEISHNSKNIIDESLIIMVKELSEKPKKYKKEKSEKKALLNNKKESNKFSKYNLNNQNILNANKFIKKEISKSKKISTLINKKKIFETINPKTLNENNTKRSFIKNTINIKNNKSNTLYALKGKSKGVINLKESTKIKKHRHILGDNFKNINNKNKNIESISFNTMDDFFNFFLTPKNNNKYGDIKIKRTNKKNSALTLVNNIFNKSQSNSEEKYKKMVRNENKLYKSKSPIIRLFLTRNEKREESKNKIKKRKSVLLPEHNPLLTRSINIFRKKNSTKRNYKKCINKAVTLSQNF